MTLKLMNELINKYERIKNVTDDHFQQIYFPKRQGSRILSPSEEAKSHSNPQPL